MLTQRVDVHLRMLVDAAQAHLFADYIRILRMHEYVAHVV
jgi:hypothetical protein